MEKSEISVWFGKRVQTLRREKGFSQEKLAALANMHRTYIGMIERAEKNVTLQNVEKIALALELSLEELFRVEKL